MDNYLEEKFPKLKDEYCSVDVGWYDLIHDLMTQLEKVGPDFEIQQIKEKFGGLRFYINGSGEHQDIVTKFEDRSYKLCESCGDEGSSTSGGWVRTLCEEHKKQR